MQYVNIVAVVKHYVNLFYFVLCQWLCFVVMKCRVLSFAEEEEPGM